VTVSEDGDDVSVKPGVVLALTVSVIVVVAVTDPEVPVTVTVNAPVVAVLLAVRVSTLVLVVGFVPNEAVTPLGRPDTASVTLPVNPPVSVTVIVSVPLLPCVIDNEDGDAASVKPDDPGIVTAMVVEWLIDPSVPVMVTFVVPAAVPVCAKKLTETVPLLLTEEGLKFACTPEGKLLALTDTLPVSPPTYPMVIVLDTLVPGGTVTAAGEAEMVKFGSAVTFRVSVVDAVVEPLVPVTVTVAAPTVAVFEAVKVRVLPEEPVTVVGLNVAVTPEGSPLTLNVTTPLKPLIELTVTLLAALVPCSTVTPDAVMLKPGVVLAGTAGNAFCTSMVNSAIQKVPAEGEFANASVGILLANALSWEGSQLGSPPVEVTPL